jgi:peptidoglycan/xylan/chitin deacetylase (PgdA/CDA1 family)
VSRPFAPLVLCYHGVSESVDHELFVRPNVLIEQVRFLLRRGFTPASAEATLSGRGRLLHVTFDDAFRSIRAVVPELLRLGVPTTVFACSDFADSGSLAVPEVEGAGAEHPKAFEVMGWDELAELAEQGATIGSHTCSHPRLTRLDDAELDRELRVSRSRIEQTLGRPCELLAYPYGDQDSRVTAAAKEAGYAAAFALRPERRSFDTFAVPRVDLYRKDGRVSAALKTSAPGRRVAHSPGARKIVATVSKRIFASRPSDQF